MSFIDRSNCSANNEAESLVTKTIISNGKKVSFQSYLPNHDHYNYLILNEYEQQKNHQRQLLKRPKDTITINAEEWLSQHKFDIYLTVTLVKSIRYGTCGVDYCNDEDTQRTAEKLLREITRKIGRRRKTLNYATFLEYQKNDRPHLHILFSNPQNYAFYKVQSKIHSVIVQEDMIHKEWHVEPVYNEKGVIKYNLKTGFNAFIPMGSSINH